MGISHRFLQFAALVSFAFATGCMAQPNEEPATEGAVEEPSEVESTSSALISPTLPVGTQDIVAGPSVTIGYCRYTIGTARNTNLPPQYFAWVRRSNAYLWPSCLGAKGYEVFGLSYAVPSVSIVRHPTSSSYLVISYTEKVTASGSAAIRAQIKTLSPTNLATLKTASPLAALGVSWPSPGYVYSAALSLDPIGNLTVTGTAWGVIPGETGSGPNYRASYPLWITGAATTPATVVRY
jgi:hypothetical protein